MNYARIESGAVAQIIVIPDGESAEFIRDDLGLSGEWVACPDGSVCDQYQDGQFVPLPPDATPAVPQSVSRRQGRLALLDIGRLDVVESAIEAIADPAKKRAAQIEYEADTWERGNQFLRDMWAQLGGTAEQLDDLFVLAATK